MNNFKNNISFIVIIISMASFILFITITGQAEDIPVNTDSAQNTESVRKPVIFPYNISESYSFKNLQLFLLSTEKKIISKEYVTLSEAMDNKYVTVFETENVNQLAVENISNYFIFICSGDIVKGGKQDRTIGKDIILPPKSGKVPLTSFCVESGRWQQRDKEISSEFSSSNYALSSRDLKVAAKKYKSQREVWNNVSKQQDKVNESMVSNFEYNVAFDVKDETSETSLQLTLENEELQKVKNEYETFFKNLKINKTKMVGYVYVINGELYGIDIFHNYKLFNDLWTKMLNSAIVEAISEKDKKEIKPLDKSSIITFIKGFTNEKASIEKEEINSETTFIITSTDQAVKFETFDKREDNKLLHLNYIIMNTDNEPVRF